jgi:Spy/CpxP family protein refolding chaperone
MKLSRATIALYVGLVFASGAVLGFFANRLYSATTVIASKTAAAAKNPPTPEEFRKWLTGYYQKHLELTDDQVQKMNLILDESQAQVKAIHAQMDPQLDAVHANQITRMNLMLTPAQQTEYEKMRKERQEKEKEKQNQRRNGRSGGPGF